MKVYIKENSWLARIAAAKLSSANVAMVIGKTIYLHNIEAQEFLNNTSLVCHELMHIKQYEENGLIGFLVKYLFESIKKGYYNNKFEIEARENEDNLMLLEQYIIVKK